MTNWVFVVCLALTILTAGCSDFSSVEGNPLEQLSQSLPTTSTLPNGTLAFIRITKPPVMQEIIEGDKVIVSASFEANPNPEIYWYRSGDIVQVGGTTVTIPKSAVSDQGDYRVRIRNVAGDIMSDSGHVKVKLKDCSIPGGEILTQGNTKTAVCKLKSPLSCVGNGVAAGEAPKYTCASHGTLQTAMTSCSLAEPACLVVDPGTGGGGGGDGDGGGAGGGGGDGGGDGGGE